MMMAVAMVMVMEMDATDNDDIHDPNEIWEQIAVAMWTQYMEEHIYHGVALHV